MADVSGLFEVPTNLSIWKSKKWPLLTSSRCSNVAFNIQKELRNDDSFEQVVAIQRWSLAKLRFDFVLLKKHKLNQQITSLPLGAIIL